MDGQCVFLSYFSTCTPCLVRMHLVDSLALPFHPYTLVCLSFSITSKATVDIFFLYYSQIQMSFFKGCSTECSQDFFYLPLSLFCLMLHMQYCTLHVPKHRYIQDQKSVCLFLPFVVVQWFAGVFFCAKALVFLLSFLIFFSLWRNSKCAQTNEKVNSLFFLWRGASNKSLKQQ